MTDPASKALSLPALFAASFDAAALIARSQSPVTRAAAGPPTDRLRQVTACTTLRGPRWISLAESSR